MKIFEHKSNKLRGMTMRREVTAMEKYRYVFDRVDGTRVVQSV